MMGYLASVTIAVSLLGATPELPQWESDYGKALEATQTAGQPLLIVLDVPSKQEQHLQPIRLSEDKIVDAEAPLLAPYKLCHVDVTTEYGKQVAKAFKTTSFPFVAIIDKSGKSIIFKKTGHMTDSEWQTTLTMYKDGSVVHVAGPVEQPYYQPSYDFQSANDPNYCPSCQNGGRW